VVISTPPLILLPKLTSGGISITFGIAR